MALLLTRIVQFRASQVCRCPRSPGPPCRGEKHGPQGAEAAGASGVGGSGWELRPELPVVALGRHQMLLRRGPQDRRWKEAPTVPWKGVLQAPRPPRPCPDPAPSWCRRRASGGSRSAPLTPDALPAGRCLSWSRHWTVRSLESACVSRGAVNTRQMHLGAARSEAPLTGGDALLVSSMGAGDNLCQWGPSWDIFARC